MKKYLSILLVLIMSFIIFTGFKTDNTKKINIAMQYGMQYAPVYVMRELGLLQKKLPDVEITFSNLGGGSSMSEALITNQVDMAFMGIPPAIIAWDKGADFKIVTGICVPPSELMVKENSGINSLQDFKLEDKIAVPSIGSIQHIMLVSASEKLFGDAHKFDNQIVPMSNPDAFATLTNNTGITSHMASMPYIDKEQETGHKSILSAEEAFGKASIVGVSTTNFTESEYFDIILKTLQETVTLINNKDDEAIRIISEKEQITKEKALEYVSWEGTQYSTEIYGVKELAEVMNKFEYITKTADDTNELLQIKSTEMLAKTQLNYVLLLFMVIGCVICGVKCKKIKALKYIVYILVVAIIWEITVMLQIFPEMLFPSIIDIFKSLITELFTGELLVKISYSLKLIFIGMGVSIIISILLLIASFVMPFTKDIIKTLISVLDPLPGVAILPLAILWVGIGEGAIIFIMIHSIVWPMVAYTLNGFSTIPTIYEDIGASIGLSKFKMLKDIYFFSAMPSIFQGIKTGWSRAWRALISAEMVFGATGTIGGLGWDLYIKRNFFNTSGMFATLLVIMLIGILVENLLFSRIEKSTLVKWGMVK